ERRADALLENLRRRLVPARVVVEGVELDVRNAENRGEAGSRGRLPRARRPDHLDPPHRRNSPRATITAVPPTSISVSERATAWRVDGRPTSAPCLISISSPNAIRPWRERWSASGPAAEPVAGSSSMPCAG